MIPSRYVYALIVSTITLCVANPMYLNIQNSPNRLSLSLDINDAGHRLPCHHDEDHIQYLCRISGGDAEMKVTIDSSTENHSWLSRANGQLLQDFTTTERKVIEKYIRLAHDSHTSYPTLLEESLDSLRVECIQSTHDHWIHKKIGFLHVVDVLSILGVGIIALTASGIALMVGRSDKVSTVVDIIGANENQSRTPISSGVGKIGLFSPTRRSFFDEKRIA
ncbi:hypothetical protein E1B28_012417 [Marasmius oreades]|uniref:Uncharacterized protein n=1 Tax=Marasmius oreades TaxID=181124 RepID=A0A9P7RRN3_9AGAR|nr:uncharacterized protein E1B28_012417 [Marasmius oreades]KAG7088422.1 hypothetical protein E1B28_012417 [Marasmius oreades]